MTRLNATPEQAEQLSALLNAWEAQLERLETRSDLKGTPPLTQSRRILEGYRRTLARDLARGLARVPAAELFRAIGTAQASLKQLGALEAGASTGSG